MEFAYPRPQMRRSHWLSLNGAWRFVFDDERRFRSRRTSCNGRCRFGCRFLLNRMRAESAIAAFIAPAGINAIRVAGAGGRVILHFGAVDYPAQVWVNGRLARRMKAATRHFGPTYDLLNESGKQTVTVRVEDDPQDLSNRAANRTGGSNRTPFGIRGRPASGRQSGSSGGRRISSSCAGRRNSSVMRLQFEAGSAEIRRDLTLELVLATASGCWPRIAIKSSITRYTPHRSFRSRYRRLSQ